MDKKFNQGKFNFKNSSVMTEANAPVKEKNLAKIQRELNDSIHVLNFLKPLSTRLMLSKNISQLNLNKDSKLNMMKKNDSFRPVKNLLFLSLDFSPTYSHRSLSNISASEAFYKSLKENETGIISPSFGINIGVRINEKYFLNTGINKVNYRSTYHSQSCYVAVDTSSNLISFNTAFDEQYFSDQEFTDNIDDSEENEFNLDELSEDTFSYVNKINLQFLKFPLTLDYGIRTENFKISFSAGFSAYWVTNAFSTIETLGFVSNRKNLMPISNNWLIGGGLGLGLEYFMTEKFSIRSSINSEKSFNAINKSSQFKIVPYWIGVNFQIRYYLN
ncbi:MAG: hypothetical protein EBS34_03970 [Flavobacteriales bacterium]|nr:hypothetical protein [Flavobacteriales bacterium]